MWGGWRSPCRSGSRTRFGQLLEFRRRGRNINWSILRPDVALLEDWMEDQMEELLKEIIKERRKVGTADWMKKRLEKYLYCHIEDFRASL